jgi:hypothetical protein
MSSPILRGVSSYACAVLIGITPAASARAADPTIKVAFWNVRSGQGVSALAGYAAPFVDTPNCTDPTKPLNAWGVGAMQAQLHAALDDPTVLALGVAEAWSCASPDRIRQALQWKGATVEQNGVALIARFGLGGPAQWLQLDTSLNPNPADTMWVVRAPVCVDSACTRTVPIYVAHWYGTGVNGPAMFDRQAAQTAAFLKATSGGEPHVFVGDLNVFEGTTTVCNQSPNNTALTPLRTGGYLDDWLTIHGSAEGYTGMANRNGCGIPVGYVWKRIDYAWTLPTYQPVDMRRFGMVSPGDASPSDHYGVIVTLPHPYPGIVPAPVPAPAPAPAPTPAPTPTAAGAGDIVLYAKSATTIAGAWVRAEDTTAGGGVRLVNPDNAMPKLLAPLAAPASYFDIPFTAETGRAYRLWIRSRAQNDSYLNDSVYVQFTGSRAADGTPLYRVGTTSAATYVLEEASGYGESGWGWQDTGYGVDVAGPPIYFDAASQTIRVQTREDGISIDQIVLSPVTYASAAPGAAKNDATILIETPPAAVLSGTPAPWASLVNAVASGATIQKKSGCGDCPDAGGISALSSANSVSFTVNGGYLLAGLARDGTSVIGYAAIDYAFSFVAGRATWDIREAGVYRGEGAFGPSDVFRIAAENGTVKYYRNAELVYASKVPVAGPLLIKTSLVSLGAAMTLK